METKENNSDEMDLEIRSEDQDQSQTGLDLSIGSKDKQLQDIGTRIGVLKAEIDKILPRKLRVKLRVDISECRNMLIQSSHEYSTGTLQHRLDRLTPILNDTEQAIIRYKNTEREVDLYFWMIHGGTTTDKDVLVQTPVPIIYSNVVAYARNGEILNLSEYIDMVENNPEFLLNGLARNGGNQALRADSETPASLKHSSNLYLVPASFYMIKPPETESDILKSYVGLRRIRIQIMNDNYTEYHGIVDNKIIIDYRELLTLLTPNKNHTIQDLISITKSRIEKTEKTVAKVLGVYSCRETILQYTSRQSHIQIPRQIGVYKYPTVSINYTPRSSYYMPLCIKLPNQLPDGCPSGNWSALGRIVDRGCGINVLSYWGVLEENHARALITGLDRRGTSMQKMLDIVYHTKSTDELSGINNDTIICRYYNNIYQVITEVFLTMSLLAGEHTNLFTIIKLYDSFFNIRKAGELNQIGHTISLAIVKGKFLIVDPQQQVFHDLGKETELRDLDLMHIIATTITSRYPGNRWSCLDVVMTSFDSYLEKTPAHPMSRRMTGLDPRLHGESFTKFGGRLTRKRKTTNKRKGKITGRKKTTNKGNKRKSTNKKRR